MVQSYWFASSLFLKHFQLWSGSLLTVFFHFCLFFFSPIDYKLKNSTLTAASSLAPTESGPSFRVTQVPASSIRLPV